MEVLEHLASARQNPPKTAEDAMAAAAEGWRRCNGNGIPFDAESMVRLQQRSWSRAKAPLAAINHVLATVGAPGRTERLGQLAAAISGSFSQARHKVRALAALRSELGRSARLADADAEAAAYLRAG